MNLSRNIWFILVACQFNINIAIPQHSRGAPTIVPHDPFEPGADSKLLKECITRPKQTNAEEQIMSILTKRTLKQRQDILSAYKEKYGNLKSDILSKIPRKSEELFLTLFRSPAEIYAHHICQALRVQDVDEHTLIDIFCCVDDVSMEDIIEEYKNHCGANADLKSDMKKRLSGEFGDLIAAILEGGRRPPIYEGHIANTSEIGVVGTDDCMWIQTIWEPIIKIFAKYSYEELVEFALQQEVIAGLSLEQSIRNEATGLYHFRKLLIKILHYAESPTTHYAQLLKDSLIFHEMTNVTLPTAHPIGRLTWILVTRSEVDLKSIAETYNGLFHKSLEEDVKTTVSSNFRSIFVNLIRGNK